MTYVNITGVKYPATILGKMNDKDWDGRESKAITLEMSYADAIDLFVDGVAWSIVDEFESSELKIDYEGNIIFDEDGNPIRENVLKSVEFDNSEYNLAGDIIDHRDGTLTVKMGKLTELEEAYEILLGGAE